MPTPCTLHVQDMDLASGAVAEAAAAGGADDSEEQAELLLPKKMCRRSAFGRRCSCNSTVECFPFKEKAAGSSPARG